MYPTYEARVYYGGARDEASLNKLVVASGTFGWYEYFKEQVLKEQVYGSETEFPLSETGTYRFFFDNTTDDAKIALSAFMLSDALSILGAGLSAKAKDIKNSDELKGLEKEIEETFTDGLSTIFEVLSTCLDPSAYTGPTDFIKKVGQAFINHAIAEGVDHMEDTAKGLSQNAWKFLGNALAFYSGTKGISGMIQRVGTYFKAPHTVEFCLCLYENKVTSCTISLLERISGDKQTGIAGTKLSEPIIVKQHNWLEDGTEVATLPYTRIKFEIVSGGGYLSQEEVIADPETQLAQTEWTLGLFGEQKLKAVIYSDITNSEIGYPMYFTASSENDDIVLSCPDDNHPHAIDLGLPSGTKWACCNVGASKPEEIGGYFAWGETEQKSIYTDASYIYPDDDTKYKYLRDDISGTNYDVAYIKWGQSWRMPSLDDCKEIIENCTFEEIINDEGYEKGTMMIGPNMNRVFFIKTGVFQYDASPESYGGANFWMSTNAPPSIYTPELPDHYLYDLAYALVVEGSTMTRYNTYNRSGGYTVRPVWK